jgi:hypothetical protein
MTASRGLGLGTSGIDTSPAPSLLRPDDPAEFPELITETEWPDVSPVSDRESRPETERRDVEDREVEDREVDDREEREVEDRDEPRDPVGAGATAPGPLPAPRPLPVAGGSAAAAAIPVGGEEIEPVGDTTGARPQVSQYSSPPPTSSYSPSQSGR